MGKMRGDPELNPRQARFVAEYLLDLNATQAAIRAGYSPETANQQASRLLAHAKVANAIAKGKAARSRRTEITQDRVLLELARIAFADPRDYFVWGPRGVVVKPSTTLTDEQAPAVAEVSQTITGIETTIDDTGKEVTSPLGTIRVKLADKQAALALLAKHVGGFVDRVEVIDPRQRLAELLGVPVEQIPPVEEE